MHTCGCLRAEGPRKPRTTALESHEQLHLAVSKAAKLCRQEALETFEKAVYIYEQSSGHGTPDWALVVMHVGQAFELLAENTRAVRCCVSVCVHA